MTKDEALDKALEALEESVDLVREDYENAKKLYGNYPSRQARLLGMEDGLLKHEAAITAIKQARSAPVQEPSLFIYQGEIAKSNLPKGFTGMLYTTPPAAPVQQASCLVRRLDGVADLRRLEGDHDEAGVIDEAVAVLKAISPAAQRQWVGLMQGVRVEREYVVVSVHGGNGAARELCAALIQEMNT